MQKKVKLIILVLLWCVGSKAQLIQGTIKPGATVDEFEIWLKPSFSNNTQYLFQIGMPIAFPAAASPQPTGINVVLDASFVTNFGSNYTVTVNPVATATGGTEKYFNIVLVRGGLGASNAQTWTLGNEFKVLTGTFTYSSGSTTFLAKLADYQDGGSDGLGNFYTQSGNNDYYITSTSTGNFYASPSNSQVGGTASAGYVQLLGGALPVKLQNFSGYRSGGKNILQWSTSIEINNKGFEVQRSGNNYDYHSIGFINSLAADGTSNAVLHYTFEDNAPTDDQPYYRLAQRDIIDGSSKLSPVITIHGENSTVLSFGGMFPNPANEQVNIQLNAPSKDQLTLIIIDGNGQQVLTKAVTIEAGSNIIPVDLSKLSKGSYLVKLICKQGCEKLVQRLVKQ
jgi:hypothetical protein